jgi:hypothetical protein
MNPTRGILPVLAALTGLSLVQPPNSTGHFRSSYRRDHLAQSITTSRVAEFKSRHHSRGSRLPPQNSGVTLGHAEKDASI